jgi:biopolymer transport protein ExbD
VLIFLMLSTTYSRFTELRINLPAANADRLKERPGELIVGISGEGQYSLNRKPVDGRSVEVLTAELAAAAAGNPDSIVVISADAMAAHQAVINVMDAARRAGLSRLTFAAQSPGGAAPR